MGQIKQSKVTEEDALKEAEEMLKKLEEQKNKGSQSKGEEQKSKEVVSKQVTSEEVTSDKGEASNEVTPVVEQSSLQDEVKEKKSEERKEKSTKSRSSKSKVRVRSKKYQEKLALVDRTKYYDLEEALELVKKTSYVKFDASVELHIKLIPAKNKKTKQELRGILQMPHFIGKEPKIAVIDEIMAEKILKEKKSQFDILLATPEMMSKIARLAKILGPQGKMPNPKTGTVTSDPEKTIKEIKSGRVEYKADDTGNIHQMIGKVSFDNKKLADNYKAVLTAIGANKVQSVTLAATMGPGVKIKL